MIPTFSITCQIDTLGSLRWPLSWIPLQNTEIHDIPFVLDKICQLDTAGNPEEGKKHEDLKFQSQYPLWLKVY